MTTAEHNYALFRITAPREQLSRWVVSAASPAISDAGRTLLSALLPTDQRWVVRQVVTALAAKEGLSTFETGWAVGELLNAGLIVMANCATLGRAA